VGRHEMVQKQPQVLYLGSSAALGTLRRSMEAHGAVTRTRLTPALDAVVADPAVPTDHPTAQAARSLGIPVLRPDEAIEQFAADWMASPAPPPAKPAPGRSAWSFRRL
jgi:UDP-N-acetylmuramoylalanine-D-glutamate ligase